MSYNNSYYKKWSRDLKYLTLACLVLVISGCASSDGFKAVTQDDGKQYVQGSEVLVSGELKAITVQDKDGKLQIFAEDMSDLTSNASLVNAVSSLSGATSLQGGLVGGGVGAIFDLIGAYNAPAINAYVYDPIKDDTAQIGLNTDELKHNINLNCIEIGDKVNYVRAWGMKYLYNQDTRLIRTSDFADSCDVLRAKAKAEDAAH